MVELDISYEPIDSLNSPEYLKGLQIIKPIGVELFSMGLNGKTPLPSETLNNTRLFEQVAQRRDLYATMSRFFQKIEDSKMDVKKALDENLVQVSELIEFYQKLIAFLERDENNARVILYLPFQILPDFYKPQPEERLVQVQEEFRTSYQKAWTRCLFESEPRANFVDGDILEPGLGDPVRIRKTGHLVPELVQRKLIETADVIDLMEATQDEELLRSLAEGVVAAYERKLINKADWEQIQNMIEIKPAIRDVLTSFQHTKEKSDIPQKKEQGFDDLARDLKKRLIKIEEKYADGSEYAAKISHKRAVWEKQVARDKIINNAAEKLANALLDKTLSLDDIKRFCQKKGLEDAYLITGLKSIFSACETAARIDFGESKELAKQYESLIQKAWKNSSSEVKKTIIEGLTRWKRIRVVGDNYSKGIEISLYDLSAPLPVDVNKLVSKDLRKLKEAAEKIKDHPVLSKYIFPFFLAFGSRLKGYADNDTDIDLAMFFKQEMPWEKREEVLDLLQKKIPEIGNPDKILEFWLDKEQGRYGFKKVPNLDRKTVGALQIHFLYGGVWFGYGSELKKVYQDLAMRYLDLEKFGEQKDQARTHLLRQIELDVLQYRLMHKGYRKSYPVKRELGTEYADMIDWESDFWDPGYRRVASLLFISRVFLPDLSKGIE